MLASSRKKGYGTLPQTEDPESPPVSTNDNEREDESHHTYEPDLLNYVPSEDGLSIGEANRRLAEYGYNELGEKVKDPLWDFLMHFWGPMPIMIWIAILVEALQMDWPDFTVLLAMQIINGVLAWHEDNKAGNAVDALKSSLAPQANVRRDGQWITIDGREVVPGDTVKLSLGGAVPADCRVMGTRTVQIDQAAMTGESMPVTMGDGDVAKMGSTIVAGEMEAVVVATGARTFFGRTAALISSVEEDGNFKKVLPVDTKLSLRYIRD